MFVADGRDRAPPHTRGSTRWRAPGPQSCEGLPRTRGDRPLRRISEEQAYQAPPHTRGSTCISGTCLEPGWAPPHTRGSTSWTARNTACLRGSPAHAGIDPYIAPTSRTQIWLPRTRGDRPLLCWIVVYARVAPPHTRGSTYEVPRALVRYKGSPAHAGIDRRRRAPSTSHRRLPRTRGDRPASEEKGVIYDLAPPHTRGSTRHDI